MAIFYEERETHTKNGSNGSDDECCIYTKEVREKNNNLYGEAISRNLTIRSC
jgi:hypothetical protein